MKLDKYRGVTPTLHACYDKTGEVSEDGVWVLIRYFVDQGVKGVYVGGSSGECIHQSMEDRKKTLEAAMGEAADCLAIIAHVACSNTRDSRTLAVHAQDLGVGGAVAIPPIYFELSEYSVAGYWNDISEAASETDFIIYNISQLADIVLTVNPLKITLLNGRVADVKDSSMPAQDIQMSKAETMKTRQDFVVFNGPDEQLVFNLVMGADGGIGGTYGAMPELFSKIYELVSENRIAETRAIQYEANETIYKLCSGTCNIYAMIEEVLHISRGIDVDGVRKPPTDLCSSDRAIAGEAVAMIEDTRERYC